MPDVQHQEAARTRQAQTEDSVPPTPGKTTAVDQTGGAEGAHQGPYRPTFDPKQVRIPWSQKGQAGEPTALDLGDIKVGVVDLGTGAPRVKILGIVDQMTASWNAMGLSMTHAVTRLVETVNHAQFKKAPNGIFTKLWTRAAALLTKGATFVTGGTSLGVTLGLEAIKKLLAHGERLEQARIEADKAGFIRALEDRIESMHLAAVAEGGNLYINRAVDELDRQFLEIGKSSPEDAWKPGDRGVVGAQAEFLKRLQETANAYTASIPSANDFFREFLLEWITANHQERNRSALRSPFDGPRYEDGFLSVDLRLDYGALGWSIGWQPEATIHCPQSAEVARRLMDTGFHHLDQVGLHIHVNVETSDRARKHLPKAWKDQGLQTIVFDSGRQIVSTSTKRYWSWLTSSAHTSLDDIFNIVQKVKG